MPCEELRRGVCISEVNELFCTCVTYTNVVCVKKVGGAADERDVRSIHNVRHDVRAAREISGSATL